MNSQMFAVMQRRGELLARIASQREQVAEIGARLQIPLALVDLGVAAARFLRSYPVMVAGAIAALLIRRRSVVGVARVIWRVWK
ncbi:MAG: YqjK family protein [Gallionella sp.]|nr:YqjK family protein [Gallionella sp.]